MAARRLATARPLIGITGPQRRIAWGWWFGALAVWLAGGRPLRMTAQRSVPDTRLDGVIIGGGDDIDPELYAGLDDGRGEYDAERDAFESAVIRRALSEGIPILGICRGAQLLNVVLGGNLVADLRPLRKRTSNRRTVLPRKTLVLEGQSRLRQWLGTDRARINSLHHQAIDRVGEGLRIVGRDLDGFVQAVESTDTRFLLGVQWHPEYIPQHRRQRRLFQALVAAAAQAA